MVESVEHVIVGAGPAGLRAAQVLAEAGREVLVLEKNDEIGPKTCGGGLTLKAVRELEALGLPAECGLDLLSFASRRHDSPLALHPYYGRVRTVPRRALGAFQAARVRSAGADLRTGAAAAGLDPAGRTLTVDGRVLRYRHLLAADGSKSLVRRALGLAGSRAFFAGEYNIPGLAREHLWVVFDSPALGNGYFWIFPHRDYASVGAGVHKKLIAPNAVRPYLDGRMAELGIEPGDTPYEGATIEVQFVGFDFPGGVHLVGDAAGVASGLTFEGIYPALITGEEVARRILDPRFPMPKTRRWLRKKRLHDAIGRAWLRRRPRDASLWAIYHLCRSRTANRLLTAFFTAG